MKRGISSAAARVMVEAGHSEPRHFPGLDEVGGLNFPR